MRKFLALALSCVSASAYAQISTTDLGILGGGAVAKTPTAGQTVQQPTGTTLSVNSLNNVQWTDLLGGDTGAKINTAFLRAGGTSSTPAQSALVSIPPGQGLLNVTNPIVFPSNITPGYAFNPTLDCGGGTLIGGGFGSTPMIKVPQQNATGSANYSGEIRNCTIIRTDNNGPAIQTNSRLGFKLTNVRIFGGNYGFEGINTATDWGGYEEQVLFSNVSVSGCTQAGISFETNGGTDSHLYKNLNNVKFDLDAQCSKGLRIGPGVSYFGDRNTLSFNINGGNDLYFIYNEGVILSNETDFSGETTANPTGNVYGFGGPGFSSAAVRNFYRGKGPCVTDSSVQTGGGHHPVGLGVCGATGFLPGAAVQGEGNIETMPSGSGFNQALPNLLAGFQADQILSCDSTPGQPISMSNTCRSRLYTDGKHKFGVGIGWNDTQGATITATTTAGSSTIVAPQQYAFALHPDDIYSPTALTVLSCTPANALPSSVLFTSLSQTSLGQPVSITLNQSASASGTCTLQERAVNPRFDLTVHGTYGSEPVANTSGSVKYESSWWDGQFNFNHDLYLFGPLTGQPGTSFTERLYNANGTSGFTNMRQCKIDGSAVSDNNAGGNICYQPGHQHFGSISTIGNESATGTTCTVGGYITLTINDVARKVAYCN